MSLALVGQSLSIHTDRQNRHGRQAYARAQRRASLQHRDDAVARATTCVAQRATTHVHTHRTSFWTGTARSWGTRGVL